MFSGFTTANAAIRDDEREARIQAAYEALVGAPDLAVKHAAWQAMRTMVLGRSPAAVAHLEHERGLVS